MQGHAKASSQRKKDKNDQLIAENAALQQEAKRLGESHIVTVGFLEFKSQFLILEEVKCLSLMKVKQLLVVSFRYSQIFIIFDENC